MYACDLAPGSSRVDLDRAVADEVSAGEAELVDQHYSAILRAGFSHSRETGGVSWRQSVSESGTVSACADKDMT